MKNGIYLLGIDPGLKGAFVLTDGARYIQTWAMPICGKEKVVSYEEVLKILINAQITPRPLFVFMEKPVSFGMGTKGAFNYGRSYEVLRIALRNYYVTLVEPGKWTKEMHKGLSADLKPKAKSLLAVKKLFPKLVGSLPKMPKKGELLDGPVDALLIAGYGLRTLKSTAEVPDFF